MTVHNVVVGYAALTQKEQAEVRQTLQAGLPALSKWMTNLAWLLIFLILAGVIFTSGWPGMQKSGSDETALYGFVGIALGAVVGLLAPSPTTGKARPVTVGRAASGRYARQRNSSKCCPAPPCSPTSWRRTDARLKP